MSDQRIQPRTSGLLRRWNLSLPCALLATALLSTAGHTQPGGGMGFGGGNGDSVGSLPSEHDAGPGAGQPGVFDPTVEQFRLVVIGDGYQLLSMLGEPEFGPSGWYHYELLGNGLVRATFSGDVKLTLDRAQLESSFVAVQLELGPVFGGGALTVQAGDGTIARTAAVPGSLPVHLQQLASGPARLLDAGVELRAAAPGGKDRALNVQSAGAKRLVLTLGD